MVAVTLGIVVAPATQAAPPSAGHPARVAATQTSLNGTVARAFGSLGSSAVSGYAVVEGVGVVIDRRSGADQPPASAQKLFTSGTALLTLGPQSRLRTVVRRTGIEPGEPQPGPTPQPPCDPTTAEPAGSEVVCTQAAPPPPPSLHTRGTLHGSLVVVAAGDPTLTSRDVDRLASDVRGAGVRTVTGGLILDDTKFDRQRGGRGWKAGYVGREAGPLSALVIDGNRASRSRSYLSDPGPVNLALFRAALVAAGVTVRGPSQTGGPGAATTADVAEHSSAPLARVIRDINKRSDNTMAEVLLKDIGATVGSGSSAAGAQVVRAQARTLGVEIGRVADGSGLSTLDRADAAGLVAWLQALDDTPEGQALRASLPVSCTDGTLIRRLCGEGVRGRVQAKTGTLDHTAALAGYTTTRNGKRVWFSFLVDRTRVTSARAAIDSVVTALAGSSF